MDKFELIAPCHFGLEAVMKREILDLGYEIIKVEDGKVTFSGDAEAIVRANMFLRTTERILLKVGQFKAVTFEELFEKTKALPWENYIPVCSTHHWAALAVSGSATSAKAGASAGSGRPAVFHSSSAVWARFSGAATPSGSRACSLRPET